MGTSGSLSTWNRAQQPENKHADTGMASSPDGATNIMVTRVFAADLATYIGREVTVKGWAKFVRDTKSTTFIVLQDVSGTVQLVGPADLPVHVKREDALEIVGRVREDQRAPRGFEVDIMDIRVIGDSAESLPFLSGSDLTEIGLDTVLDYRPLALRTDRGGTIFRVQAALVEGFRSALRRRRFTEIFSSKIVAGGTEGGANLFAIRYFERVAYLAQSPQFYKEHGVAGLERVFETGHVYRAEPHATCRHLTEYYSLDFEMGFIDGRRMSSKSSARSSPRCSRTSARNSVNGCRSSMPTCPRC